MDFETKLKEIYNTKFLLTESKKSISQTQRNELKYALTDAIVPVLEKASGEMDLRITQTIDGYIMEVENDMLGMIPIELIVKVRGINYDIYGAEQELAAKKDK